MKSIKHLLEMNRTLGMVQGDDTGTWGYREPRDMPRHDDPHARAVDMINQAVEDNEDHFELIGDVDKLIDYLKGKHHDWTPQLEQLVRDIIAEEIDTSPEEEEYSWGKYRKRNNKELRAAMKSAHDQKERMKVKKVWQGRRSEENEETFGDRIDRMRKETKAVLDDSNKRRQARKYGISGPSGRRSRMGSRSRGRLTSMEQQEEFHDIKPMSWEHMKDINKAVSKAVDILMSNEGMDQLEASEWVADYVKDVMNVELG